MDKKIADEEDARAESITGMILAHQDKAYERMRFKDMINWLVIGFVFGLIAGMVLITLANENGWFTISKLS